MTDHDVNDGCKEAHNRFNKHIDDMTNVKDGVVPSIYNKITAVAKHIHGRIDATVSMRMFQWIAGFLIAGVIGSYGYATKQASEHDELTSRKEVDTKIERVEKRVDKIEKSIENLNIKLDNKTEQIIDAINKKK